MPQFELVPGRKGPNDCLVRVYANGEVLSFSEWLYLGVMFIRSEDSYYPKPRFKGGDMLIEALLDARKGMSIQEVCARYKLPYRVCVR